ncbi:hypothetical protein BGX27_009478, partial [Mortierella sp. AM989]
MKFQSTIIFGAILSIAAVKALPIVREASAPDVFIPIAEYGSTPRIRRQIYGGGSSGSRPRMSIEEEAVFGGGSGGALPRMSIEEEAVYGGGSG